jgi:hypothetical protein
MSYMVSIEGSNAPTVIHPTYASAQLEAERLATQPRNRDRVIHVLELVSSLKPVTKHYWEHREEPLSITGKAFDADYAQTAARNVIAKATGEQP